MTPEDLDVMLQPEISQQEPQGVATAPVVDDANARDSGPIHPAPESVQHSAPVHAEEPEFHSWVQPNLLDAPPPRPGFVQRWINVGFETEAQSNIATRRREGWRPRDPVTVPSGYTSLTTTDGRFSGTLMVQGMCLMEMTEEASAQRRAFYSKKQHGIEGAVEAELDGVQARGGIAINRTNESKVVVGGGKRPEVLSDRRV